MDAVPLIGIAAAHARQIRAGALGAELEGMVVHRLAGDGIMPVALHFGLQRPHHLRVAEVAALPHIHVAARRAPTAHRV